MIRVQDLQKAYGSVQALRGVSFDIAQGDIVGLLGHNGAVKRPLSRRLPVFCSRTRGGRGGRHRCDARPARGSGALRIPAETSALPELKCGDAAVAADLREIPEERGWRRFRGRCTRW